MKKLSYYYYLCIFFLLVIFTVPSQAQDDLPKQIQAQLTKFYLSYPVEKVYLHLDKPYYAAGETIWFKAYLSSDVKEFTDSLMSKVLYVELIGPDDSLVRKITLKVSNSSANGDFKLKDSIPVGEYRIRAYTNYLKNFGSEYFFEKVIPILKPDSPKENYDSEEYSVQFFPEGGDMVDLLRSTVGIKVLDGYGRGVECSGAVFEKNNPAELANFKSNAMGMGSFRFLTQKGKEYIAKVTFPNYEVKEYVLPNVVPEGYVLNVDSKDKEKIKVLITGNISSKDMKARQINLVAQQAGKVYFYITETFPGSDTSKSTLLRAKAEIASNKLPSGIIQFTLFDGYGRPHCERLVCIVKPEEVVQTEISSNKKKYQTREKINLSLKSKDQEALEGDFSISVTDANRVTPLSAFEENILTYFKLSSELKGRIEQPAYYFQDTPESRIALDNLMLTQGWRRFSWKSLMADQFPSFVHIIEPSLCLEGNVDNTLNNGLITIISKKLSFMQTVSTDDLGNFLLMGLDFTDTADFKAVLLDKRKERKMTNITLFPREVPTITPLDFSPKIPESIEEYLDNYEDVQTANKAFGLDKKIIELETVTVKNSKIKEKAGAKSTYKLHNNADFVLEGEALQNAANATGNVLNVLQGRVPGLIFSRGGDAATAPEITIRGASSFLGSSEPLYLYNGMPVSADFFTGLSSNMVESIEVLKGPSAALYGTRGANGVIAVYSKQGASEIIESTPEGEGPKFLMEGYYQAKEFYQPNYDNPSKEEQIKPDLRTTIYWDPNIKNPSKINFFAADNAAKYLIIIEGSTKDKKWIHQEAEIQVEK